MYCESIKKLLKRRDAAQLHTELNIVDLETKKEQKVLMPTLILYG